MMKRASSTEAKNNFGQVLDDVLNHNLFIVERHGTAKAIIMSLDDFTQILDDANECRKISAIIKKMRPHSVVGRVVTIKTGAE